ncbi:hypothetical protein FS935_18090 [Metabacillus litoralis]|uniref:Uncharacterized protein n=1 Tax=Metabacillus litoralis TaxID=152268 RepID=A0A5C6VL53_9BACI|nr:hypothetical protein [Metabacillus litoralis]TXC85967.1 hypothetical protein FS935_18090 [Metabacillus litoralis]
MNNTVQLIIFISTIVLILVFYRKSKEEESLLLLKLFGFTFLGAFMLDLNGLKLPLGFAVFLLFFRQPKVNAKTKNLAAYVGLVIFMLGIFIPRIENMIYERTLHVDLLDTNFYSGSLEEEIENLSDQLNMNDNSIELSELDLTIVEDGTYERFKIELVEQNYEGTVNYYNIDLSNDRRRLEVKRQKVKEDEYQNNYMYTDAKLVLGNLDIVTDSMLDFEGYKYIQLITDGRRVNYNDKGNENFQINTAGKNKIDNNQLPVQAIVVDLCKGNKIDEYHSLYDCKHDERFLLDMLKHEVELTESSVIDAARHKSPEIDDWLMKHIGDFIGFEENGEFILIKDGVEEKVQESEYMMTLKETPLTTITQNEHDNLWEVTVENPYGDAPHIMEFTLEGETREILELKFR